MRRQRDRLVALIGTTNLWQITHERQDTGQHFSLLCRKGGRRHFDGDGYLDVAREMMTWKSVVDVFVQSNCKIKMQSKFVWMVLEKDLYWAAQIQFIFSLVYAAW